MKKLLIMSIALVAIMATVFTVSAFAANTVEIGNITIGKYYDTVDVEGVATQVYNDAYAVVTVPYTVTGDVDRLTFYLAAQDLSSALEGEEAKVIYIDETVNPEAESFTFVIEKARVKSALSLVDDKDADITYAELFDIYPKKDTEGNEVKSPFVMTFKLGGTDVDTAADCEVVYVNPIIYGDADGNGALAGKDSSWIARHVAGLMVLNAQQITNGDADGSGALAGKDSSWVARCVAGLMSYGEILSKHTFGF